MLRIFVDERDRAGAQPLYTAVVEMLRKKGVAGATVFRGIEGFGSHHEIHVAKPLSWVPNLPVVIEVVDSEPQVEKVKAILDEMVTEGLVTIEPVTVLRYAARPRA